MLNDAEQAWTNSAAAAAPEIRKLLTDCPFLASRIDLSGPYAAIGTAALLIQRRELSNSEADRVFTVFNELGEHADTDFDLLTHGALEIFNDDADTARLARKKLTGRALTLVEEMRLFWGQPDYSSFGTLGSDD